MEKRLKGHIFGYGDTSLPREVGAILKAQGLKLAIYDAVTQGRLSGLLGPNLATDTWGGSL